MAYKALPPAHVLRQLIAYDPDTGTLTWKHREYAFLIDNGYSVTQIGVDRFNKKFVGAEAFTCVHPVWENKFGGLLGENFEANRIAWAIAYGEDPIIQVDHINGNPGDNRLVNLRKATGGQNCANRRSRKGSTSRFLGVDRCKGKWRAQIRPIGGQNTYIGQYDTEIEAAMAYDKEARRLHGQFARPNFAEAS